MADWIFVCQEHWLFGVVWNGVGWDIGGFVIFCWVYRNHHGLNLSVVLISNGSDEGLRVRMRIIMSGFFFLFFGVVMSAMAP